MVIVDIIEPSRRSIQYLTNNNRIKHYVQTTYLQFGFGCGRNSSESFGAMFGYGLIVISQLRPVSATAETDKNGYGGPLIEITFPSVCL